MPKNRKKENEKNGIIVDNDWNSLHFAMKKLISEKKLLNKYSAEIYKTVQEKFSWEKNAKKILGDIDEKQKNR